MEIVTYNGRAVLHSDDIKKEFRCGDRKALEFFKMDGIRAYRSNGQWCINAEDFLDYIRMSAICGGNTSFGEQFLTSVNFKFNNPNITISHCAEFLKWHESADD